MELEDFRDKTEECDALERRAEEREAVELWRGAASSDSVSLSCFVSCLFISSFWFGEGDLIMLAAGGRRDARIALDRDCAATALNRPPDVANSDARGVSS